ncbi:hypothetical protein SAMN05660199_03654 [Klenkia soli]|uniref:Uncharacterized protein n=1 Tax=Klenkia soli TaxID=1052260 RepID=A0A1H0RWG0_9ACTN|nr:hypothetical protein [Klenkia soli]SDP33709.1 hypothetical protein SAMN05660199_03654 [Klenkia soli]
MTELLVVVPSWVLGDGAVPPPARGDQVVYRLAFHERDPAAGADPTVQELHAHGNTWAEPWNRRKPDGTTGPAWPTRLDAVDWRAHWSAPREVHGAVDLVGVLVVDPLLRLERAVSGTVVDVHVISEEVEADAPGTLRGTVPGSLRLRAVDSSPRWFDDGPLRTPPTPGWHPTAELRPRGRHRRESGALVTLRPA